MRGKSELTSKDKIVKKIQREEVFTKSEKCIIESIVSSTIDRKNILVYASAFDVLARYSITEAAAEINFCRPMIQGSSDNDLLAKMAEKCPVELKNLSSEDLDALHTKAIKLNIAATNFNGSVFEFAFGTCVK
ncbi:MAG: hypothetical protein JXQ95_06320 [Alteromonas stellipolaris]|uniref:hypothetical protein n=1 Tax=Alteromonas stellipolaris TaxID=233316 RepID=UPI003B8C060C